MYLEAARRLALPASDCVAIEDSADGIRSAAAAQMKVVVIPNHDFPPAAAALATADLVLPSLNELTSDAIERFAG